MNRKGSQALKICTAHLSICDSLKCRGQLSRIPHVRPGWRQMLVKGNRLCDTRFELFFGGRDCLNGLSLLKADCPHFPQWNEWMLLAAQNWLRFDFPSICSRFSIFNFILGSQKNPPFCSVSWLAWTTCKFLMVVNSSCLWTGTAAVCDFCRQKSSVGNYSVQNDANRIHCAYLHLIT